MKKISLFVPTSVHLDHYTRDCDRQVEFFLHLQKIPNQFPDVFRDIRVTKSYVSAPVHIEILKEKSETKVSHEITNRGWPSSSKNQNPRKVRVKDKRGDFIMEEQISIELLDEENQEILIYYASTCIIWNQN